MQSPANDPLPIAVPPGLDLRENEPLAPYTTFGIGGPARCFLSIVSEDQLDAACRWAAETGIDLFVLGGGSNILVADAGFPGLVLRMELRGVRERTEDGRRLFAVAAGEDWDALVTRSVEAGCAGIECLAGIPGTVGGTPVQNVGAYGQEVAQTITTVRCYDRETHAFVVFPREACGFAYRASRFNTSPDLGRYIVTEVEFALSPGRSPVLAYADLERYFAARGEAPTLVEVAEAVRVIRRRKAMVIDGGPLSERDPDTRSAGSFFKNPVISEALFQQIVAEMAPLVVPHYPAPDGQDGGARRKLPAAWLLEQAGFARGFSYGRAALSSKHTLALTNHTGDASAADVLALRDLLIAGVAERFHLTLEPEPIPVG